MDEHLDVETTPKTFSESCSQNRNFIKSLAKDVLLLKVHPAFTEVGTAVESQDHGEMTANIMLAYRHLEDAAMRLGKAIQAFDGGKSIYGDK